VTQKQMMDANPGVNWNRLRIGQKIFIPAPAKP
jgi:LysM repeat protein